MERGDAGQPCGSGPCQLRRPAGDHGSGFEAEGPAGQGGPEAPGGVQPSQQKADKLCSRDPALAWPPCSAPLQAPSQWDTVCTSCTWGDAQETGGRHLIFLATGMSRGRIWKWDILFC